MKDEHPRRAARGANLRGAGADVQRRGILDHDLRADDVVARRSHRAPGKLLQPRVAAQLDERPIAIVRVGSQCEDSPRRAVEQDHLAARAGHDHRLGHAAQNRLELVALLGQRVHVGDDRVGGVEQMMLRAAHRVASVGQQMRRRTPLCSAAATRVESFRAARQRSSDQRERESRRAQARARLRRRPTPAMPRRWRPAPPGIWRRARDRFLSQRKARRSAIYPSASGLKR